jgi:protocatechuate 3,4-dioxygenase beta subunit
VVSSPPLGYEPSEPATRDAEAEEGKTVTVEPFPFGKGTTLQGIVRTLDGIPQAGVHIYGRGAAYTHAVSDAEGRFTVSGLKKGEKLSFLAFLMERRLRGAVNMETASDTGVDILLKEFETTRVEGRVVDMEGNPIPEAKVQLIWKDPIENIGYTVSQEITDTQGEYAFEGLIRDDTYMIVAGADGYSTPGMRQSDYFVARSGMPPYKDYALLKADRWAEIHIEGPDGKPISEARVQLYGVISNQYSQLSDRDGNVRFENIAETIVNSIFVSHDNFGHFEFRHVPTNTSTSYCLIKAEKYLSGKVADPAGKPVKDAYVRVEPSLLESGLSIVSSQTAADGVFHLNQMVQNEVQVTVSHPEYAYKVLDGVRTNQKDLVITLDPKKIALAGAGALAADASRFQAAAGKGYSVAPIPRQTRIAVDGDLADWNALPAEKVELLIGSALSHGNVQSQNPPSKEVLSATLRCGSDGDFLHLAVDVLDDDPEFGFATFDYLHVQDCIEFIFHGERIEDPPVQLVVTLDAKGKVILGGRAPIVKEKFPGFWESAGVRAALRKNPQGYTVETAVPWSVLEWIGWGEGKVMGLNVRVYDGDTKGLNRYLVEWSSDNGAGYRKLLGAFRKPSPALFRSPDHEKIHAALAAMQKKDWTEAEKVLRDSENTPWAKPLLSQTLISAGKELEGTELRKQVMRDFPSSSVRDWILFSLIQSSQSLEMKGQYRNAIAIMEGMDFSGRKTNLLLRCMLQQARCYCLNSEYIKAEPLLEKVIGSAAEKEIADLDNLVLSARQMQVSVERMKKEK